MRSIFLFLAAFLALTGGGCRQAPAPSPEAAGLTEQRTARLQFLAGDTFEIRQTFLGFGAFLPDLTQSKDGVRLVHMEHFAPMATAGLRWSLAAEKISSTGTVSNIDLKMAHTLFPPAYWKDGDTNLLNQKSALWLSDDAFQELTRTRKTTANFDVFGESASQVVKNITELKSALAKLRQQASAEEQRKDLNLLEAEEQPVEWPLKINGADVKVSAIKARNWFGEIVVLNNRQNPLVLKLTIHPIFPKNIFGYEIANLIISNQ